MSFHVEKALAAWGFEGCPCDLVAERENSVYRVSAPAGVFALRCHRIGYRSDAELRSELNWVLALAKAGLSVPKPIGSKAGNLVEVVKGVQVDVVSWLSGDQLGETGVNLAINDPEAVFHALGEEMAKLHTASDAWQMPKGFKRCAWDRNGLLGDAPLWGRFWENPTLSAEKCTVLIDFRKMAESRVSKVEDDLDYGLIHADLVRENVLIDNSKVSLIDFDDGGFGFRLFDIATTLFKNMDEPNYEALKTALIEGYLGRRKLDVEMLDLFIAIRAVTYVGWIVPRLQETGATTRNERFIRNAMRLCRQYLDANG